MSWGKFGFAAPELAVFGTARLTKRLAYLATIRADGAPRVHPVSPFISHDTLFVYMEPTSPKGKDLRRDGRYAMHCSVEDASGGGGEFCVRGRAVVVDDLQTRGNAFDAARAIGYKPNDRYVLFELGVEEALATTYEDGCQFVEDGGRVIEMENESQIKPDGPLAVETYQRLVRARKFIDQCYHLPLNLQQISSEACLSRFHFLRLWVTVAPKDQSDFEIVLMEPKPGFMFGEEDANQLRSLIANGKLGAGVFNTPNCQATYDELSSRGVEFLSPPAERPYGIEAIFKDNSGNWFSLTQHKDD